MAADYSADSDDGVYNSRYERPAMLSALGDVADLHVLDLGCCAGQLGLELVRRQARVTGIDVSPAMIEIAKARLGDLASFDVGDLGESLPYEDASFDVAVASLVMHYIQDWVPVLHEVRRVLKPGGTFVFSTHHPTMDWHLHSRDDYFAKVRATETWTKRGREFEVTFWRRPLAEMSREIQASGFHIASFDEPMPHASLAGIDPATNAYLTTHPHFLFVRLTSPTD